MFSVSIGDTRIDTLAIHLPYFLIPRGRRLDRERRCFNSRGNIGFCKTWHLVFVVVEVVSFTCTVIALGKMHFRFASERSVPVYVAMILPIPALADKPVDP